MPQFTYNYVGTTRRLQSVDYPSNQRTIYDYWPAATAGQLGNGDFRLKQIANYGQGTDISTLLSQFEYTYDVVGNIKKWSRKLGANATDQTYTLGYDDADQLTRAALSDDANPNNLLYRYYATFDRAANLVSKQEDGILTKYGPNNLNQIASTGGGGTWLCAVILMKLRAYVSTTFRRSCLLRINLKRSCRSRQERTSLA